MLSYVEGRAALAAAPRDGRLSARAHSRARGRSESVHGELVLVGVDEPLVRVAGELAEDLRLRGYDTVPGKRARTRRGHYAGIGSSGRPQCRVDAPWLPPYLAPADDLQLEGVDTQRGKTATSWPRTSLPPAGAAGIAG